MNFDIGVDSFSAVEVSRGSVQSALQKTIEIVAHSVRSLRPPSDKEVSSEGVTTRVLVIGADSDERAHYIAERNYYSGTVGSPLYEDSSAPGVFWVTDPLELDELDDSCFDAVFAFNISNSPLSEVEEEQFIRSIHRILKPTGVFAGTGVFSGLLPLPVDGSVSDGLGRLSLQEFRKYSETNGFFVHVAMDLSLEGNVVMTFDQDAKQNEFYGNEVRTGRLVCARFLASKAPDENSLRSNVSALSAPNSRRVSVASLESPRLSRGHNCSGCACGSCSCSATKAVPKVKHPNYVGHAFPAVESTQGEKVLVSGLSLGLPNALRPDCSFFDPNNFQRVFDGENCISVLTEQDKQRMIDQNIVQVLKVDGKRVKKKLTKPSEVISLASRLGKFDLAKEYGVPAHVVETLDITFQLAIAAGLEALSAAGIPVLQRRAADASSSSTVPTISPLPEAMKNETGIIFASSFPCTESTVEEITKSASYHALRALQSRMSDKLDESILSSIVKEDDYEFDRKLLFKLLVMANSQLAELIHARGPNIHVNSACASTTQAIAIAEDWIRGGRCRRVVVISADNATSPTLFPYLGTGFLALTAASIAPSVETGALPFDKRRNGMILGMGAVGLVLEASTAATDRMNAAQQLSTPVRQPLAELVATHFLNSAFHASLLDREHISSELKRFVDRVETQLGVPREEIARDLIYYSHETCTCAQGGCAKAEMDALSKAFGEGAKSQILIANTKGFTGHPMGVGLEDAVAVASLDAGLIPPIANYQEKDPCLGEVLLSQGGSHTRKYALRFAAGFGSQFTFLLFKKWTSSEPTPLPASSGVMNGPCACRCDSSPQTAHPEPELAEVEDAYLVSKPAHSRLVQLESPTESEESEDYDGDENHKQLVQRLHRLRMLSGQNPPSELQAAMGVDSNLAPVDSVSPPTPDGFRRLQGRPPRPAHADVGDSCTMM